MITNSTSTNLVYQKRASHDSALSLWNAFLIVRL